MAITATRSARCRRARALPFNASYEALLFDVARIPFPDEGREQQCFDALEAACKDGAAAFVAEPLILGAGGMLIYSASTLREMKNICARHGVLFVADEVMTGFGRTGTLFACEQAGIVPDIACYAKGLTGGALPLAVTMCGKEIFDAHLSDDRARAFFHSSSYTANPIACAAALANLDIWEKDARAAVAKLCAMQAERIARFESDPRFINVRRLGTITALDLATPRRGYLASIGLDLLRFFNARGLLLRPLGQTIYVLPPYCIEAEELDLVYAAIDEAAAEFRGVRRRGPGLIPRRVRSPDARHIRRATRGAGFFRPRSLAGSRGIRNVSASYSRSDFHARRRRARRR